MVPLGAQQFGGMHAGTRVVTEIGSHPFGRVEQRTSKAVAAGFFLLF